jgi:hypothetical protein
MVVKPARANCLEDGGVATLAGREKADAIPSTGTPAAVSCVWSCSRRSMNAGAATLRLCSRVGLGSPNLRGRRDRSGGG